MLLYNIAASQDIMYCRPPGPRESPHFFLNGSVAVPPHFLFFLSLSPFLSLSLSLSLFPGFSSIMMFSIFLAGRLSLYLSVSDISLW
jgi:hypothetical protein